ncbi:MAG: prepilin-type N-terminal cleavage/methylation domain-containing protein [Verrucomicrobiota bacterium]|nr:prepilin-type N-terminal cleavage/methylation domain-containing protein [Verrucomicrobiota bacterium]
MHAEASSSSGPDAHSGFTLIEVLVVVALIVVMTGFGLAVIDGLKERALRARAHGEMAVLAQALERYRSVYGDYPWLNDSKSDGAGELYLALTGKTGPKGDELRDEAGAPVSGPCFVDSVQFSVGNSAINHSSGGGLLFLDPWERPYIYQYKRSVNQEWKRAGFLLLSLGGEAESPSSLPADGLLSATYRSTGDACDDLIYNE